MPTTASASFTSGADGGPTSLVARLSSGDPDVKLRALREVKNQIIGSKTKKLGYIKLGAVPRVASILSAAIADGDCFQPAPAASPRGMLGYSSNVVVQSAAALGSFACGFDEGVQAVLAAGALPLLVRLLDHPDDKVVDVGARSLKMIYQSEFAPKYEILERKSLEFLVSLLNREGENVTELGASIIAHSCRTVEEQKTMLEAGVLKRLVSLLDGSVGQRDASLGSLAAAFRNNAEVITEFMGPHGGKPFNAIFRLTVDSNPKTRLLACQCLIVIRNATDCYVQELGFKRKLVTTLLELLDDPGQVGDECPFVLSSLVEGKEDLHKIALEADAMVKLRNCMDKENVNPRRLRGVLLALADLCSKLESCRSTFLSMKVLKPLTGFLNHKEEDIRIAACTCLKNVTRSVKNLCAGYFMKNEALVNALILLLTDASEEVQVAALGVVSNIVVDFTTHKSMFVAHEGMQQLFCLSKSMVPAVRSNALRALRNMTFLADDKCKEAIYLGMTPSLIANLIRDDELSVKEQALALVRNLVDGSVGSIEQVFADDSIILDAVGSQLQCCPNAEVLLQGIYVLGNIACGNEIHKEAVTCLLFPLAGRGPEPFFVNFLLSSDSRLRLATIWVLINLTLPSPGALKRQERLQNEGVLSIVRSMVNDPCLDVKIRVRTLLTQTEHFGDF
ncbi:unnamed protein product [Linum trigynum]|uniref:Armadillo repeat-containing protein 8 n=1 Tax=Linum trigynum TaxID=586398 RepID=A0AAV2EYZ1_9ROSI